MRETGNSGVLCAGRLYCDLIFSGVPRMPTLGTEVFADGLQVHIGGGAAITAQHLSSLGRPVALSAYLPGPPFRDFCESALQKAGLDTSLCLPAAAGLDPQITVAVTGSKDRAFLTRRSGPPCPLPAVDDISARNLRHLHIGELATLVRSPEILEVARAAGATVSLDCSWDETLGASVAPLIAAVDVFLPNEEEAQRLHVLGLGAPLAPLTVTKCGAAGATAVQLGKTYSAPAARVSVVDTTGAGDAFNAGFLAAWLDGADLPDCLASGNRCGTQAVQVVGGAPCAVTQDLAPSGP